MTARKATQPKAESTPTISDAIQALDPVGKREALVALGISDEATLDRLAPLPVETLTQISGRFDAVEPSKSDRSTKVRVAMDGGFKAWVYVPNAYTLDAIQGMTVTIDLG